MILQNQWLKNKVARLILLTVVIQLYLISNHIIPAYEEIPYFTAKIKDLKQKATVLEINNKHFLYFRNRKQATEKKLTEFQHQRNKLRDKNEIQNLLNLLYQHTDLEIVSQQIETKKFNSDLSFIIISLSLKGKYRSISAFLEKTATANQFIVVSKCELANQTPLSANPDLLFNGVLTVYLAETI